MASVPLHKDGLGEAQVSGPASARIDAISSAGWKPTITPQFVEEWDKLTSTAERFAAMAERLEKQARETLAADDNKLKNTARRAEMAASTRATAREGLASAATLRSLSEQLATGDGDDVSFLANLHRHNVWFTVRVNVHHADREIEFFQLKRFCQSVFPGDTHDVGNASMEQLAERLLEALIQKYPKREWEIRVMEDNENGAVVKYSDA